MNLPPLMPEPKAIARFLAADHPWMAYSLSILWMLRPAWIPFAVLAAYALFC